MTHLAASRTYPVGVKRAFDTLLPAPLPDVFGRRYGPIAPIVGVDGQTGVWGKVGQQRTIRMADGTTMRETLTAIERPARFTYTIDEVRGALKPLVAGVEGAWSFEPAGTGVRITWAWDVEPTGFGRHAMPIFRRLWAGSARQALEDIEKILLTD